MQPMAGSASKPCRACAQLVHELVVQRIELLGAVERDDANLPPSVRDVMISYVMGLAPEFSVGMGDYNQGKPLTDRLLVNGRFHRRRHFNDRFHGRCTG
jgi:hypothetical protein